MGSSLVHARIVSRNRIDVDTQWVPSLAGRLPPLVLQESEIQSGPSEETSIRITGAQPESAFYRAGLRTGNELVEVDGEPFFVGLGLDALRSCLVRELDEMPKELALSIRRGGKEQTLLATLSLQRF